MVLKLAFDEENEQKIRELAMKKFGYSKGSLTAAGKEAFAMWRNKEEKRLPRVDDQIKLIDGIMSHLRGKYTSVELQHEALKLWAKGK